MDSRQRTVTRKNLDLSKLQIKKKAKAKLDGKKIVQCTIGITCHADDWQVADENYKPTFEKEQGLIAKVVSWFLIDGVRVEELTPWHLQVAGIKEGTN